MDDTSKRRRSVELLQQLGLKEYEARCFVALSRTADATAKRIAEVSEVPRTRVYDAVRVLESKGLVEKQHSNPQRFRAVGVDEAVGILIDEYEDRTEELREVLAGVEPVDEDRSGEDVHQVWALTGSSAVAARTQELIDDADEEIVIVVGTESLFDDSLLESLESAVGRGVDVVVGTLAEPVRELVANRLPDAQVFVSGLEWLRNRGDGGEVDIGRLLMIDRETILVSSIRETGRGRTDEQAVFGRGFTNGLVVIVRRLMATGLLQGDDPGIAG
jgi:sugar-specific transcriptional regulator TrmB